MAQRTYSAPEVSQAPDLAVLVGLNTPCSIIRRIYHAKVLRQVYDILFIKDESIEIHAIDSNSNLKLIASRDDLDGTIKSSLILPEPLDLELDERDDRLSAQENPSCFYFPRQILTFVLQGNMPHQLHRQLVFTFLYYGEAMKIKFATFQHALPSISHNTMGTNIAVQSNGRILAVAAQSGAFSLYRLKPWTMIRDEVEQDGTMSEKDFNPVMEERLLILDDDHIIWHLEFVPSPANEPNIAYLVIILESDKHVALMLLYKIDYTKPLKSQTLKAMRQDRLGSRPETRGLDCSLFVAPLRHTPGLILGAEDRFAVVPDIRKPELSVHMYPPDAGLKNGVNSRPKLLYNTWARTSLSQESLFFEDTDLIYLARQDGQIVVLTMQFTQEQQLVCECSVLGGIGFNVDKAFAVIDLPDNDSHVFITGGSHSNGAIVRIGIDGSSVLEANICSLDPIIDTALVPCRKDALSGPKRVYATTARGSKHGTISELRNGYEVRVCESITTVDEETESIIVDKVWILPHDKEDYLITVTPSDSACQLYRLERGFSGTQETPAIKQNFQAWSLVERDSNHPWFSVFEDDQETVAVALTRYAYYLRVTRSAIQQLSSDLTTRENLLLNDVEEFRIMSAVIDSYNASVLFVARDSTSYGLCYLSCRSEQSPTIHTRLLDNEPSCIYLNCRDVSSMAILSTQDGNLDFYDLECPEMLLLTSHSMGKTDGACESIIILERSGKDFEHDQRSSLMCGFRSGLLKCFDLVIEDRDQSPIKPVLVERDSIFLGSTSVQLTPIYSSGTHTAAATAVLIICEEMLYLHTNDGHRFRKLNLKRLWLTDSKGNGLRQGAMLSSTAIPPWIQSTHIKPEDMFFVVRDAIHHCRIQSDSETRNLPWQIHVGGSPHRIIWSDYHKRLIVGLKLELKVDTAPSQRSKDNGPFHFSAISIIDPFKTTAKLVKLEDETSFTNEQNTYAAIIDPSGDHISSLAEWEISLDGRIYHMLLVSILEDSSGDGKVHIFNFKAADKPLEQKATYRAKRKGPVVAIAVYDSTSVIALTSNYLIQLQLTSESGALHFRETISMRIPSPGTRHLRVQSRTTPVNARAHLTETSYEIMIGTASHGLEIYKIFDETFRHVATDTQASLTYASLTLPLSQPLNDTNIILQIRHCQHEPGNLTSQISAHHQTMNKEHLSPLFTVPIPNHLTSLQPISLRPRLQESQYMPHPRISAFALDAAVYNLDMIPLPVWRVLRLLQNLIEVDGRVCPFRAGSVQSRRRAAGTIVPDDRVIEERHVNADILMRVLKRGEQMGRQMLRELIGEKDIRLIRELLGEVVGLDAADDMDDGVDGVVEALFTLLVEIVDAP